MQTAPNPAFDEQRKCASLDNTPMTTTQLALRMQRLACDIAACAEAGNWTRVEHLARRVESLSYRVRNDSTRHAIAQEAGL